MTTESKAVFSGNFLCPCLYWTAIDFDCATAIGADQVMVVSLVVALAVQSFSTRDGKYVDCSDVGEGLEGSVDGCEADVVFPGG
ncbi:hypothetical protein FHU42_002512 [Corynebacterium glutamicum]|nr:hypothetical protein [Corynebacterium glutamicum]